MKIGILGGTFDPIHVGHLAVAKHAYHSFSLDEIWFMPNGLPPHKMAESVGATSKQRLQMVKNAVPPAAFYHVFEYEVKQEKVSYSYETFKFLNEKYPNNTFYFIIGADSLFSIEQWKFPEILLKECILITTYRDGYCNKLAMKEQINYLHEKYEADIKLLEMSLVLVSSREIREAIMKNDWDSIQDYLEPKNVAYIQENRIYTGDIVCKP